MWRITKLEVWVEQKPGGSGTLHVITYTPDANNKPDQVIEDVSIFYGQLPASYAWLEAPSSTPRTWRHASQGLCITLEAYGGEVPARIEFEAGGLSDPMTGMLDGNGGTWNGPDTARSIGYKIEAEYTTLKGGVGIVPGSWRQTPGP